MKPFRLGLTGSIGMGKTTTARLFADQGIPVWDADQVVRDLYAPGRPAAVAVAKAFPQSRRPDGSIDRAILRDLIRQDATVLDRLNALVHPLVRADRADFLSRQAAPIVLLDIPLLFETGADADCDAVVVVTAPAATQRARVLERGEMSEADFKVILGRQMPDAEKRARADFVIHTTTLDTARRAVKAVLQKIRAGLNSHA
jgi:dephospho-CoA kinase